MEFTEQLQNISSTLGDGSSVGVNKVKIYQYTAIADEYIYMEFNCEHAIDEILVENGTTELASNSTAVLTPVNQGDTVTITITYGNITGYQLLIEYNLYYIKYGRDHYVILQNDYIYPAANTITGSTFVGSILAKSVRMGYALPDVVLIGSNMLTGVTFSQGNIYNEDFYDLFDSLTAHFRKYMLNATQLLSLLQYGLDNDTYFEGFGISYTYHDDTVNTVYLQSNGKNTESIVKNGIPVSNNSFVVLAITDTVWAGSSYSAPNEYQVLDGVLSYISTVNGNVLDTKKEVRKTIVSGSDEQIKFVAPKVQVQVPTPSLATRLKGSSGTSPSFK